MLTTAPTPTKTSVSKETTIAAYRLRLSLMGIASGVYWFINTIGLGRSDCRAKAGTADRWSPVRLASDDVSSLSRHSMKRGPPIPHRDELIDGRTSRLPVRGG